MREEIKQAIFELELAIKQTESKATRQCLLRSLQAVIRALSLTDGVHIN